MARHKARESKKTKQPAKRWQDKAYDKFIKPHEGTLRACIVNGLSGHPELIEDVLQTAKMEIVRSAPKFRGEASSKAFAMTIAHNCIKRAWRDMIVHERLVGEHLSRKQDRAQAPDPIKHLEYSYPEQKRRIAAILDQANLYPMPRKVMELVVGLYEPPMSIEKIAARLGKTNGAIRTILYRSRKKIRKNAGELLEELY
jgi:RNA polymerase sigma factor (sigma-70 family)